MKRKKLVVALIVLIVAVGTYMLVRAITTEPAPTYQFGTVTKGDIETTVSATGTLSPVTTVEIGTQVSGIIDSVYVDFNDEVHEGQVLAVLDTVLLRATVLDAEANVERVKALVEEAEYKYNVNKRLYERKVISEADFIPFSITYKTQKAALKSAQVALDRAQHNLQYAVIKSPIDGIVISRNVESGQTVAASLSAPTLFVIAQDLSHMEILADIDESDIGQIKDGQPVRFEVTSYPDRTFTGTVKQVRLQPQTVSNVVTYTAVVSADNSEGLLLPGMTATLDFITENLSDVLLVPSKALVFRPSEKELEAYRKRREAQVEKENPSAAQAESRGGDGEQPAGMEGRFSGGHRPNDFGTVWYVDSLGQLATARLRTGMSDGNNTQVVASRTLTEGMQVIISDQSASDQEAQRGRQPSGFRGRGPHF